jgi:Mitochondrial K+-H+ exchange-related
MDTVRVLTLPIAGRFILWHAWREAPAATGPPKEWTSGRSLREKATLLGGALQHRAATFASAQWSKLESAPPGTLNARLFTIAQSALSRVDPSESFLKSLPSNAAVLEVLHPVRCCCCCCLLHCAEPSWCDLCYPAPPSHAALRRRHCSSGWCGGG